MNPMKMAATALGVALVGSGIFAVSFWPSLSARHSGETKAVLAVFDRADGGWERGWRSAQVALAPDDNPVRIVIEAEFLPGSKRLESATGIVVVIARGGEVVGEHQLDMSLPQQSGSDRQPRLASVIVPEFAVNAAGLHTIAVRSTAREDMDFAKARAEVRVRAVVRRFDAAAYVAISAGAALVVLFGGGRKRRDRQGRKT
jgi:hypothetical protein